MRFIDLLRTAFLNLWRRKLRAVLTVLGMVIGTCSIVVMVSLGIGMRQAMIDSYAQMGSLTNITVMNWKYSDPAGDGMGNWEEVKLDKKAVEAIRQLPGVVAVMPQITAWGIVKSGRYVTDISIMAIDTEQAAAFDIKLESGDFPSSRSSGGTYEIVFGNGVTSYFYDPKTGKQAVDRDGNSKITIDSRFQLTFDYNNIYNYETDPSTPRGKFYKLVPSGVVSAESNEFSWYCLMDIEALEKLAKENETFMNIDTKNYNQVIVKCESTEAVKSVKAAIDEMGYGTNSLQDWIEQSEEQIQKTQYLLGAIGGVSLLVAAIGIMNTMMMSIYERTKEIGIIKVLGCRMGNIAGLFLTESAYIGLFGGAIGIGLSYGISTALNKLLVNSGLYSLIPVYLAVGAVAFSMVVALVSGFYPAIRAMRLSPLAAIRNE
ncbi:MAG: Macrolide export ATP-binding/permease protein MacB [Firmicutes bacterium ADurb.Bin248]|nr:MAG: Macrolide export ATP-binding/permease protein MacB [Firmicutes bacterium ADurb.Bin248]HOG01553.1 ABC transporter permease [Clostridia bacterium]HPK14596.1 ABC transporter permease [Clostridia bacterium]